MSMNPVSLSLHHHQHRRHHHHRREQMFEKALTPSDVGKLNRLVIPKQHAERYFPLAGCGGGGDKLVKMKELALGFEDEAGKPWRFRYSYWSSSQSYVLTKGWSRFVKEKKLHPGDVVVFERLQLLDARAGECYRHFIGCRRKATGTEKKSPDGDILPPDDETENENEAVAPAPASSKRLRLFGVNLECGPDSGRRPRGFEFSGYGEYVSN